MSKKKKYSLSPEKYELLFDTFYASLCVFGEKYVNDIEVTKDIVQEVFIKIWENKVPFTSETAIKSYLYTSVKNKALDYLKSKYVKSKSQITIDDLIEKEKDSFFSREVVLEETLRIVNKAVNKLPPRCGKIIRLSMKGLSNGEISEKLSISINTVKAQKRIAYDKLRRLLENEFLLIIMLLPKLNNVLLSTSSF